MPKESLQALYNTASQSFNNLGTYNEFEKKMQDSNKRKLFYDVASKTFNNLGSFDQFEAKVTTTGSKIDSNEVFPVSSSINQILYNSVKRQENSVAKNNPYGINMPRKKENINKIISSGGSIMEGSKSLLEFKNSFVGKKIGESIIDNIFSKSANNPARFYSSYSGLPIDSPEVKSFVEIFNQNFKKYTPQYSLRAAPAKKEPGVSSNEYSQPIPGFEGREYLLTKTLSGKAMLQQYGWEIIEPEEPMSAADVAKAQNKLFLQNEIAKEKQKGLSERDAYRKVVKDVGGTPPNIVDLAMEQSITGAVFRIMGMDQTVDVSNYPVNKLEQLASGALAMVMPVDAVLFKYGGLAGANLKNLKTVGKLADKTANILSKKINIPLGQARVLVKGAVERVTGGAGGFAAFDGGRDIASQIEYTGKVNPLEAVEATMKGFITGGAVSTLGILGSIPGGKVGEFVGEIFGLGTVAPFLEGEDITAEGYLDAAGTIIGLKMLKTLSPRQATTMQEVVAQEIQRKTETTGRPMHEVANEIGKQLKTSLELAIEGNSPEKVTRGETIILGEKPVKEAKIGDEVYINKGVQRKPILSDIEKARVESIDSPKSERVKLNEDIKRLSEEMDVLEKSNVNQNILDQLQERIDSRVERLNEMGVGDIAVKSSIETKETPSTPEVELQMRRRARSEQERLDKELEDKDILNRQFEADPMLEVPLHPADVGRKAVEKIEKQVQSVDQLEGQKKSLGLEYQREYNNLDKTLRENIEKLQDPNITELQKSRLEQSNQRTKELKRDVESKAESNGIEMQVFLGIPNPKLLKKLFGSSKHKVKRYSDSEIDRLYNNAIDRLSKDKPKEEIVIASEVTTPVKPQTQVSKILNWFTGDMVERMKSVGTPTSIQAAELGRQAIDIQKKTHGELSRELDVALKASGSGKAAKDLARFVEVDINGSKVLVNRLHAAIEGLIEVKGAERDLVEKHKDLIEKRGNLFEKNEIMQEGPDGEVRPFKVMGRDIAPRIMSGEFYRILEQGVGSVEFNTMVKEFVKATGLSEAEVQSYFSEMQSNIRGDSPETPTRTTQAEHSRKWKNIPHAIKVGNELIPLIEYRPYEYARRLADTGESRIGVASVFGQELAGTSVIKQIKDQIAKEGGDPKKFHEMIRALSAAPVETQVLDAGTASGKIIRGLSTTYSLIRQSSLSASLIPNIPEVLGNIRRFSGMDGLVRSIYKLSKNPLAVNDALEQLGAITVDIANVAVDPNRPISSRVRAINEAQSRAFLYKYINEFQEKLSAVVALDKVERFKKGKGTGLDALYLREMGFSRSEAELMSKGNAPQSLYDSMIRRAPAHLSGGAARSGERSRIEHNKIFQRVAAFETYAQMKMRSLNRMMNTNIKALEEAVGERDYGKLSDVTKSVMSDVVGNAAAGAASQFLLAYAYGGKDNAEIKWNEVKDDPLGFIISAWAYTSFAGTYGAILQSTAEGNLENPLEMFYPYVVGSEIVQGITGTGGYKYDQTTTEKAIRFAKRFAPVNRPFSQLMVATGLGNKEAKKTDNAIKAYYRWKIDNGYGGKYVGNIDDDIKQFRGNMNKAVDAMVKGKDINEIINFMLASIDGLNKDEKSIKTSLLAKRLLTKAKVSPGKDEDTFNERLDVLRKKIGDKAYQRLRDYDELLTTWSESF